MRPRLPRLHAITDERVARRPDLGDRAGGLASAGGSDLALHARGRRLTGWEHYELARHFGALASPLFVNDRLDVALAARATGVQLGLGSLAPGEARRLDAEWWVGRSAHSLDEARSALAERADYLLVGPVYETATHPSGAPLGVARISEIALLGLPVIAIGGVTPERVRELARAGAYGVAAIRALWDAPDPSAAAREMLTAMDET